MQGLFHRPGQLCPTACLVPATGCTAGPLVQPQLTGPGLEQDLGAALPGGSITLGQAVALCCFDVCFRVTHSTQKRHGPGHAV